MASTFMTKTKTKEICQVHLWQKTKASIMANTFLANMSSTMAKLKQVLFMAKKEHEERKE